MQPTQKPTKKKNNLVRFVCKKQIETSLRGFQFPVKIKHDAMRTHNARRAQETPQHESAQQYMSHSAKWHKATSKLATLFLTDKAIYFVEESIYNNKYHLCHIPVHPFSQHPKLDNQKLHRTGGAWRWCPWSFQWTKHPTIKTTQIQFPTVQVSHVLFIKCVT